MIWYLFFYDSDFMWCTASIWVTSDKKFCNQVLVVAIFRLLCLILLYMKTEICTQLRGIPTHLSLYEIPIIPLRGGIVPELKYQEVLEMRKNFTIGLYGIFEVGGSPKCLPTPYAAASYNTPLNLLHWKLDCYVNLTCHRNTMG